MLLIARYANYLALLDLSNVYSNGTNCDGDGGGSNDDDGDRQE